MPPHRICYFAGTHGNWGGSSRVLFTILSLLDRKLFDPIVLLSGRGPAEALLQEAGVQYQVWGPMTEPGNPIRYARAVARTCLWMKRHKIALVHMNRANDWRPAELLALRICRIPVVTHFHTVNTDHAPATRWSQAIAAVSNYVATHSDTQNVPTTIVHNTVDVARFGQGASLRESLGIAPDHQIVSFIGQIREIKGVADFIAMSRLVTGKHVRFLIVGQCRDKAAMGDACTEEELRRLIGDDPRVKYCGYVEQVEDIYRTSDIVVVPSRWQEPFGLICIEAGAAGKPIIATRSGGMPEVIMDGVTGFLVEIGDTQSMATRVQQLLDDTVLRNAMGTAARRRVIQEFTHKPMRVLEHLYTALLMGGNKGNETSEAGT